MVKLHGKGLYLIGFGASYPSCPQVILKKEPMRTADRAIKRHAAVLRKAGTYDCAMCSRHEKAAEVTLAAHQPC
jgi:hypothetical protein